MSDLAIIPVAGTLDDYSDPAAFVELALTHSKQWLTSAIDHGDIAGIVELKSQAEAIRVYTAQKNLGKEVELNAAEIVRRAERGLGLAVRKGQAAGGIAKQHATGGPRADYVRHIDGEPRLITIDRDLPESLISPSEIFSANKERTETYAMTDGVGDEQFEEALADAREEKNLSRANVVRKIKGDPTDDKIKVAHKMAGKGNTTQQIATALGYSRDGMRDFLKRHNIDVPADRIVGRTHNLNSTRIVEGAVGSVHGIGMLFEHIVYGDLPAENVQGWLDILNESIRSLTTLRNRLKELSQP